MTVNSTSTVYFVPTCRDFTAHVRRGDPARHRFRESRNARIHSALDRAGRSSTATRPAPRARSAPESGSGTRTYWSHRLISCPYECAYRCKDGAPTEAVGGLGTRKALTGRRITDPGGHGPNSRPTIRRETRHPIAFHPRPTRVLSLGRNRFPAPETREYRSPASFQLTFSAAVFTSSSTAHIPLEVRARTSMRHSPARFRRHAAFTQ